MDKAFLLSTSSPRSAALRNNFVDAANSAGLDTDLEVFYAGGGAAEVTDVVATVAGKTPRTLDHFIQENIAAFKD